MKSILIFLACSTFFASTCNAQQSTTEDLAELLASVTEIANGKWRVVYAYDSQTVTMTSFGKVSGSNYAGGLPNGNAAEYPVRISFRLTEKPSEERARNLKSLMKQKLEFVDAMTDNSKAWAGYSKMRPRALSKSEWGEYIEYTEIIRKIESLAAPTHAYKSLHFVDESQWHISPAKNQSADGIKLLAQRNEILAILARLE